METFLQICKAIGSGMHWLTGWLVHPEKGGCCDFDVDKKEKE